jgi:3-hydroxybutyryl-CoA dehydrogenase
MDIQTITVVGSGLMGRGIAYAAALGAFRAVLHDVSAEALDRAVAQIRLDLGDAVNRAKISPEQARDALQRVVPEPDLQHAVAEADFVVEAVPEEIGLKMRIFEALDRFTDEDVILASNTSALSVTEIAAATRRPERVLGMHFFNPVPKMKLVEIVRALETGDTAVHATTEVARRMGKETVLVRESPGFITSRINALIGNEAFLMLEAGVASAEDIDKALKLGLNHPMGPFEMADLVGLDVRYSILQYLHETLGDTYRPSNLMGQYVKAGRLGRKTGRGVYTYDADGKRVDGG